MDKIIAFLKGWWKADKISFCVAGALVVLIIVNPIVLLGLAALGFVGSRVMRCIRKISNPNGSIIVRSRKS